MSMLKSDICQMSSVICQISSVKCQMSSFKCQVSNVKCQMLNAYVDPWEMMNNFWFHVYAQMSLFIGENDNGFFGTSSLSSSSPVPLPFIELVPS